MIFGNEQVIVKRDVVSGEDIFGLPITSTVEMIINNCLISWGTISESLTVETTVNTDNIVIQMPISSDVQSDDIVTSRGEDYKVNGNPVKWIVPKGFTVKPKLWVQAVRVEL